MANTISDAESQQLLRTIEMFEAITATQPDDYQSLEILKETYSKLGRRTEALTTSKKLAEAYARLGQISQAILEYEGILQEYPDDESVRLVLEQLESQTTKRHAPPNPGAPPTGDDSKLESPPPLAVGMGAPPSLRVHHADGDGDRALADVLIAEKLLTRQAAQPLLQRLQSERLASARQGQTLTLVQLLTDEQIANLEDILLVLVNRSDLPYLPLSTYDLDRDIAYLLPQESCFQHCVIPFDLISRSVLVATANPFDEEAKDHVQTMLNYSVLWYVAAPGEILAALRRCYGIDNGTRKA